jgi:hypothetical protein
MNLVRELVVETLRVSDILKEEKAKVLTEDKMRNKLIEKAKTKPDGVYSLGPVLYRVNNNTLTHYAEDGQILEVYGHFNVIVGKYEFRDDAKRMLKSIVGR